MGLLCIVPDIDLTPELAVVQALQGLQPALEPHHVRVTLADPPPDGLGGPPWRFELTAHVLDPEITVHEGTVERGLWRPTALATPAEIRNGIAIQTNIGWVVAAAESEDETTTDLVEAALAHVIAIEGE